MVRFTFGVLIDVVEPPPVAALCGDNGDGPVIGHECVGGIGSGAAGEILVNIGAVGGVGGLFGDWEYAGDYLSLLDELKILRAGLHEIRGPVIGVRMQFVAGVRVPAPIRHRPGTCAPEDKERASKDHEISLEIGAAV